MKHLCLVCLIGLCVPATYAAENVNNIIKQIEAKASPPNERVELQMIIQEPDGSKKIRELTILRQNTKSARALIRLKKPTDLKGLALLTVTKDRKEEQYLYLPSDKKSRRILGSSKKGKFLDSEIAFEDLSISTYKDFDNKITKSDGNTLTIESRSKPGSESTYGRILTKVSKPDYKIESVEYFDRQGKPLKQAEFIGYQKVGSKFWRARSVKVKNLQTKRQTQLFVRNVSLKKIQEDEISLAALED